MHEYNRFFSDFISLAFLDDLNFKLVCVFNRSRTLCQDLACGLNAVLDEEVIKVVSVSHLRVFALLKVVPSDVLASPKVV